MVTQEHTSSVTLDRSNSVAEWCKTFQRVQQAAESSKEEERTPDRLLRWRERLNHLFPPLPAHRSAQGLSEAWQMD